MKYKIFQPQLSIVLHKNRFLLFCRSMLSEDGIVIWAAIIDNYNLLVCPFKMEDGAKITSKSYFNFLQQHLCEMIENELFLCTKSFFKIY